MPRAGEGPGELPGENDGESGLRGFVKSIRPSTCGENGGELGLILPKAPAGFPRCKC